MTAPFRRIAAAASMSLALLVDPSALLAQGSQPRATATTAGPGGGWQEATAGSELEDYLRTLQVAGLAPTAMVGLRAWSAHELARITPADSVVHPWRGRLTKAEAPGARWRLDVLRPQARTTYNSSFPFGMNDGAVWKGRGVTQEVSAGVRGTWGPLTVQLAPVAFWAQNAEVELAPNGLTGDGAYGDVLRAIDRPQRFGPGSYARVDPGQSTVRLDAFGVTVGVSTANEVWGPGVTHPLLMSANAAGIPRLFAGTSHPVDVWVGRVHARVMAGQLRSTPYAPPNRDSVDFHTRAGLGAVVGFSPRFLPGLEVGVTRFYQTRWSGLGHAIGDLSFLYEGILKTEVGGIGYDTLRKAQNQEASAYFRWALPPAMELYGELYREDHSFDFRDLLVEPEHDLGYLIGFRRVWRGAESQRLTAVRLELVNGRPTAVDRVRPQAHLYTHGTLRSGHTNLGQVLGSEALLGGGGGILAVDRYTPQGRISFAYQRVMRNWREIANAVYVDRGEDVIHAIGGEVTRFRGPIEWRGGAQLLYEVNRDFTRDVAGVQLTVGARWAP